MGRLLAWLFPGPARLRRIERHLVHIELLLRRIDHNTEQPPPFVPFRMSVRYGAPEKEPL